VDAQLREWSPQKNWWEYSRLRVPPSYHESVTPMPWHIFELRLQGSRSPDAAALV
jgi:hypothetical protein